MSRGTFCGPSRPQAKMQSTPASSLQQAIMGNDLYYASAFFGPIIRGGFRAIASTLPVPAFIPAIRPQPQLLGSR